MKHVVLCVDDEKLVLDALKEQLQRRGGGAFRVETAEGGAEALEVLEELTSGGRTVPVVVSDHRMPGMSGADFLARVHRAYPRTLTILLTGQADGDAVGRAVNEAALYRYVGKPWSEDDLALTIREALRRYDTEQELAHRNGELENATRELERLRDQLRSENAYLRSEIAESIGTGQIVGKSHAIRRVLEQVRRVGPTDANVLIVGESGTGKELVARAVHAASNRAARALVKVNCAALPSQLVESELFGHEKGAFTGAIARRVGRFELADRGTIFLDEIGEMPVELQAKLLRVLQEGELQRLGGSETLTVDVRVIAATNQDLHRAVSEGRFREDLYYRLAVFPLAVPALRERAADVEPLARHFVGKLAPKLGRRITEVPPSALDALRAYTWPGNVRELENVIARSLIVADGDALVIVPGFSQSVSLSSKAAPGDGIDVTWREAEIGLIRRALSACDGRVGGSGGAARRLDIPVSTLRDRMKRYGIDPSPTSESSAPPTQPRR